MKHITGYLIASAAAFAASCLLIEGCTTPVAPQTVVFNSLNTVEIATTSAFDGYSDGVIKGTFSTNALPQISHDYNNFQALMLVAIAAAHGNTNAVAPTNLVQSGAAIVSEITTNEPTK